MHTDKYLFALKRFFAGGLLLCMVVCLAACRNAVREPESLYSSQQHSASENLSETDKEMQSLPSAADGADTEKNETASDDILHPVGNAGDDYILPDAEVYAYSEKQLSKLSDEELRIARNELYARHGHAFRDQSLRDHFEGKIWYRPEADAASDDSVLNSFETENLRRIIREEQRRIPIEVPQFSKEEFPVLDGSTATLPISQTLYQLVTGASKTEAEETVYHSKTTSSYRRLAEKVPYDNDAPSLVIAYEPSEELYEELSEAGEPLIIKPIGKDALVFMTNTDNSVTSLTGEQIVDLYAGRIRSWKEVGGRDEAVLAFQRPANSGSQNLMEKLVMRGAPMAEAPSDYIFSEMGEILEALSAYDNSENAIGYSVYYYAQNMYEIPNLRFMAVNEVLPDNDTIRSGAYPYVNDFYAAVRKDEPEDSPARILFDWLTTDNGQALINELGYVGLSDVRRGVPDRILSPDNKTAESEKKAENSGEIKDAPVINLGKNQVLLADGKTFLGLSGTVIYDGAFNELSFLADIATDGLPLLTAWNLETPIKMRDTKNMLYGIYDLKQEKWLIEPAYSNIDLSKDAMAYPGMSEAEYAAEYADLFERFRASAEDITFWWPSDSNSYTVAAIREGDVYHVCSLLGEELYSIDAGSLVRNLSVSAAEAQQLLMEFSENQSAPVIVSDDLYCQYLHFVTTTDGEYHSFGWKALFYENGKLVKKMDGETFGGGLTPGDGFYLSSKGNYISVYNYQDELVKRVLNSDARMD